MISRALLFLSLTLAVLCRGIAGPSAPNPPNILLILVDDMSINGISCYGQGIKPWATPHIDTLAKEGLSFSNAYAYPVCSPTRAALMTGKNPVSSGITNWIPGWTSRTENPPLLERDFRQSLPTDEYTLAEALQDRGYATGMVGKWHLGERVQNFPHLHGFDFSYPIAHGNTWNYFVENTPPAGLSFHRQDQPDRQYITDHFADRAISWMESQKTDQPWFMFFSTHVVHTPVAAKQEIVQKYLDRGLPPNIPDSAAYAAMHELIDDAIGRLLQHLHTSGQEKNTLVVFLSDNGGREPETTNTPLRGGKGELLEGGIRTPLIFKWPGSIPAGRWTDQLAVVDDLFPSLLGLIDTAPVDPASIDGIDLSPVILSQTPPQDRTLFFHYPHYTGNTYGEPSSALRQGSWKLIHRHAEDVWELYDLSTDPGEAHDLAATKPKVLKPLQNDLIAWREDHNLESLDANPEFDPAQATRWNGQLQRPAQR